MSGLTAGPLRRVGHELTGGKSDALREVKAALQRNDRGTALAELDKAIADAEKIE